MAKSRFKQTVALGRTEEMRDLQRAILALCRSMFPNLEGWIKRVGARNPARAVQLVTKLLELVTPRAIEQSVTGPDGERLSITVVPFIHAARMQIEGKAPNLTPGGVRKAAPGELPTNTSGEETHVENIQKKGALAAGEATERSVGTDAAPAADPPGA